MSNLSLNVGKMPVVFFPHGAGPWPFMEASFFGPVGMWDALARYLRQLSTVPRVTPRGILVISAHWEAPVPTVMTAKNPPLLYDYYGFSPEAYQIQWSAPGHPELADQVCSCLEAADIPVAFDGQRGFDHGAFVPLKLAYPEAQIPTIQLSLKNNLDPAEHLAMGRALAPLREEGVFILGSGMSYHNITHFMHSRKGQSTRVSNDSKAFDDWLAESVQLEASQRDIRFVHWDEAPSARACHPKEEHLLPLMVCAGAAKEDVGRLPYRDVVMNAHVSAVQFG